MSDSLLKENVMVEKETTNTLEGNYFVDDIDQVVTVTASVVSQLSIRFKFMTVQRSNGQVAITCLWCDGNNNNNNKEDF